jgi:hypothetical protein
MNEKPKRKNTEIKCPCCGFTDVLVNPIGLDEGTFMCQTCSHVWDIYGNQTEPSTMGLFLAVRKGMVKLWGMTFEPPLLRFADTVVSIIDRLER